jgi:hypothetical protein
VADAGLAGGVDDDEEHDAVIATTAASATGRALILTYRAVVIFEPSISETLFITA